MGNFSQDDRPFRVDTALGKDVLLLQGFNGDEGVSIPFGYTLDLLSEDAAIDAEKLLRTAVTLTVKLADGGERVVHGLVNRFSQSGQTQAGELTAYRAQVVPWFWFLSLSSDCKLFQNLTALEIIEKVFRARGFSDFEIKCVKPHPKREYCVQYRETDLNFVSRLLEEEGVFYFFRHTKSKHVLVLADDNSAVKPSPAQSKVRMATQSGGWQEEDVVTVLQREHVTHIGKVTLRDYDYLQPSLSLESSVSGQGKEEVYDYPGTFTKLDDGERLARLQLEEREGWQVVIRGESTCRGLETGCRFDLKEHYRSDANDTYFLLHLRQTGRNSDYRAKADTPVEYRNSFVAIPHKVPFRPPRTAPKPVVQGSQTALVVGKSGEEIWVDKYGRVKVQFYWDRDGKKDENSSCWVRVATTWAGKQWGHIQLPRIGQEVIVDFLEGDPDLPIITGRVYNAEQMPPYELPANQTQSGVKSRSSKGGGTDNFNEIRLEDKKGSELFYIHAEKDKQVVVENNRTESVGTDESITIGKNRTEQVGENESITIGKSRTEEVGEDESITIGGGRTESVGKDESITIGASRSESVAKDESITIGANRSETVGKSEDVSIGQDRSHEVGKNDELAVGMNLQVSAGQSVEIKVGQSSITIDQKGVTIKGMMIQIEGQMQTELKGMMTNVKADAMLTVKGGITMIN
jgi:type VI secretion system secreted protein VgrG